MIGIVVVSHSVRLAEGVREMVGQMVHGQVPLAVAAGIESDRDVLGTDPLRVQQAIQSVYCDDGVVVLMDLGSALMSAEMAIELLPEEQRAHVHLCPAPLVEGAVAAAVQAASGAGVDQVLAEARGALAAKAAGLGQAPEAARFAPMGDAAPDLSSGDAPTTSGRQDSQASLAARQQMVTVTNRLGIHARPAAELVRTASRFQSRISARNTTLGGASVDARSINQVMGLGARRGHQIVLAATGPDADEALATLAALFERGFDEGEDAAPTTIEQTARPATASRSGTGLTVTPISPGIAVGPLVRYRPAVADLPVRAAGSPESEWRRLETAVQSARREIEASRQRTRTGIGGNEASIFDAHLLFLEDSTLLTAARQGVFERRLTAEAAWQDTIARAETVLSLLEDPYQRQRAADVTDVGLQVLQLMVGVARGRLELAEPAIVLAGRLTPSEISDFDPGTVLGLCADFGSSLSHSAILARGLGIPAVMGDDAQLAGVADGTPVALDGESGCMWVQPDADQLVELGRERERWLAHRRVSRGSAASPALTRDGHHVRVVANIGSLAETRLALTNGADGVGVLRTEFLFMNRPTAPSEEEQLAAYAAMADQMGVRPFIIRTLDVGGDKPLPYLDLEYEANPFLGWRGIRVSLGHPDMLRTQLRAVLRASPGHDIKVMFPMVASPAELRSARALLVEVQTDLRRAGVPFDESMEMGMMVEVPAAVMLADRLASEVQFFSIGTNDLSQYVMAADRTNRRVAALADGLQPAVLRAVHGVVQAAHAAGIWAGLCGELAADPLAVPLLVGMGMDELSLNPAVIPAVKEAVRGRTLAEAQGLLARALALDSAEAVRELLQAHAST
jgi:phosphoenolpyruvate-protein phosphotransferase/dihydroxyacetone kinase phosphotransfer subunit